MTPIPSFHGQPWKIIYSTSSSSSYNSVANKSADIVGEWQVLWLINYSFLISQFPLLLLSPPSDPSPTHISCSLLVLSMSPPPRTVTGSFFFCCWWISNYDPQRIHSSLVVVAFFLRHPPPTPTQGIKDIIMDVDKKDWLLANDRINNIGYLPTALCPSPLYPVDPLANPF